MKTENDYELEKEVAEVLNRTKLLSYDLYHEGGPYINCNKVYHFHFGNIASHKNIYEVNHEKAMQWVDAEYKEVILKRYIKEGYSTSKRKVICENVIYILKDNMLIDIEDNGVVAVLFEEKTEKQAHEIADKIKKFKKTVSRKSQTRISLMVKGYGGIRLVDTKIKKPKLQVAKQYNDDLLPLHEVVLKNIRKKDNNGLFLFHGTPGTGKSTYIRYLIHCQNKRVLFLPPTVASNLDSPELTNLLIENKNSIIVVEDAEELLVSRDTNRNSGISMLLNLTDGLLGESLGIQVICTFNTQVSNIDSALLRKGRLTALYEFKALAAEKANALLEELGVENNLPNKAMTLAELYHLEEQQFQFTGARRKRVGFMTEVV